MSLDLYKKPDHKAEETVRTSVRITKDQDKFLRDNNLNVSKLVRDLLNKFIKESNK